MKLSSATHTIGDTSTPPTCMRMRNVLWPRKTIICCGYGRHKMRSMLCYDLHMMRHARDEAVTVNACQSYSCSRGNREGRSIQLTGGIRRRVGPSIGSVGATDSAQGSFLPSICT